MGDDAEEACAGPHAEVDATQDPGGNGTLADGRLKRALGFRRQIEKVDAMDAPNAPPRRRLPNENRTGVRWNEHDELIGMIPWNHLLGIQLTALNGNIEENRVSFRRFTVRQCKE